MKLMSIEEYQETCYTKASQPSKRTIIRLIKDGGIAGRKIGKYYYIDISVNNTVRTGNPLVDRVLLQK
jgi:hypothetical protein